MKTDTNTPHITTPKLLLQHGYHYLELIGEGANGKTYKAKNLKTGEIVAIKELKFSENLKNYELFNREAETLKSINTPGVPMFYDYITSEEEFTECWLVQEFVIGESILDKMEKGEKYNELQTLQMMLQTADIISMLQTMYTPPIIHRDIKPSNILIRDTPKDDLTACLIDFGAVANPQRRGINSTVAGTVGYMAPEQLLGDCTIQSDYYALGATALHMLTGTPPSEFVSDGFKIQFEKQLKDNIPEIHKETIELFHKLLAPDAKARPQNSKELMTLISETLKKVDDNDIIRTKLEAKLHFLNIFFNTSKNNKLKSFFAMSMLVIFFIFTVCIFAAIGFFIINILHLPYVGDASHNIMGICCLSGMIIPVLITMIASSKMQSINNKLKSLPDYNAAHTLSYTPITSKETNISDNASQIIGTIQNIHGDIIEYTVKINNNYYAAFCHYPSKEGMNNIVFKDTDNCKHFDF